MAQLARRPGVPRARPLGRRSRRTPRDQGLSDERAAQQKPRIRPSRTTTPDYRTFPWVGSRVAVWVLAQLHLLFAAFVLAVPMFAFIIEFIGYCTGDKRYDKLAYEFTKLLSVVVLVHRHVRRVPDRSCWSRSTRSS